MNALVIGIGLPFVSNAGGGGSSSVTGDPLSFAVSNATILSPDVNGKGIFANGWSAAIVFKGLSASVNPNAFDGSKVTLTVTDPGYDSTGSATTVTRTIKGSICVRQPYPNNGLRQITTVGSDLQLIVALEDIIYQGTTITQVACAAAAYPGSNAITLTGASVTNGSTRPYPKPFFGWLNRQFGRATGSAYNVECVAYHRHGRANQQVACVQYTAKDTTGHSASVTVSAPALSSIQTRGNIVEAWKGAIPLAGLDQTTSATGVSKVHAKVYPFIGDSSAILDTEVDGIAWPTVDPWVSLQFVNDKNGTYGGGFAYVKSGASGGTVSATEATARAAPFPTIMAAFAALATWNNTNRGHNDHSGSTIRLMDDGAGGAVTHQQTSQLSTTAGLCWTTIEADPLNTAAVNYQQNAASIMNLPDLTAVGSGVTVLGNANAALSGASGAMLSSVSTGSSRLSMDGCVLDPSGAAATTGTQVISSRATYVWSRNVDWKAMGTKTSSSTVMNQAAASYMVLMLGNTAVGGGASASVDYQFTHQYLTIGNAVTSCKLDGSISGTTRPTCDALIYANNLILTAKGYASGSDGVSFGGLTLSTSTFTRGVAIVQNVFEGINNGQQVTFNCAADSNANTLPECLDIHNTILGNRGNWLYCDNAGSDGFEKRGVTRYSLWFSKPIKTDTFAGDAGATSNWEWCYQVGSAGTVVLCGASTQSSIPLSQSGVDPNAGTVPIVTPVNDSHWSGMYWPSGTYYGTSSSGYSTVSFSNDQCGIDGSGSGGGDYHLTGATSNAYSRVPSGLAMLAYDLSGVARKNDGTGASGAYERTV